jgi:hypothetical protein
MIEQSDTQLSFIQRMRRLLGAYVRDHQYDSAAIESTFQSTLGESPKMFNPLKNDTKVAVTTTTARGNVPCILSNYNGGSRGEKSSTFLSLFCLEHFE